MAETIITQKQMLVKALKLERSFQRIKSKSKSDQFEEFQKFKMVWGESMADHFLSKYGDAESLIWALDPENLELFIEKF